MTKRKIVLETIRVNYESKHLLLRQKRVKEKYSQLITRLCVSNKLVKTILSKENTNVEGLIHMARALGWTGGKVSRQVITEYLMATFNLTKEDVK